MRTLLFIAALLSPCLSTAATYCVKTEAQLSDALNSAALSAADDEIRLTAGVFKYLVPLSVDIQGGLSISGGWSGLGFGGGCTKQALGAKSTLLGSPENGFALMPRAALSLERLDFVNWASVAISDSFADPAPSVFPEIRIARCSFSAMRTRGLFMIIKGHHTHIENSLFTGNAFEGLKIFSYLEATRARLLLQFNTFAENGTGLFVNAGNPPSLLQVRVLNTVFANQVIQDFEIYGPVSEIKNSLWNSAGFLTLSSSSTGNLSGNAGLNSQLKPLPGSQLIDAGNFDAVAARPKFDYAGGARLLGLRPDIGAYEAAQ